MNQPPVRAGIGKVTPVSITEEMERSYLDYAMSVIVSRALPDAADGLKPVQRRIIYAIHGMGFSDKSAYTKSAKVVGEVLGKYHPHGDMPVYDALARMAQDFSMREPLIDGQGNWGSIDGDPPAAMRYTECRLSSISMLLLSDIEKDTVKTRFNFDNTLSEPTVLPAVFPNLLTNGASGIAVGMATNIPPHNLGELIDLLSDMIQKGRLFDGRFAAAQDAETIATLLKGPDFPTGGIIYDRQEIARAYATGKGRIVMRARTEIEEGSGGRARILITEIPYQVNKAQLIVRIADLVKGKRVVGIADLRDESDRRGMQIVIELKRDANPQAVLNRLFKETAMQTVFNVNMVALDHNVPKLLSLKALLEAFVNHRLTVITRKSKFELKQARARSHILEGLQIALDYLDAVIQTIRKSRDADTARKALVRSFSLTDRQATAILDMQLRRLAALERQKIADEYAMVKETIAFLEDLLKNPTKMLTVMREELSRVKEQFGTSRKTRVVSGKVGDFAEEDLVPDEPTIVTITKSGYVKRTAPAFFRIQHRGGKGILGMGTKGEDRVLHFLSARTHDNIYFFTNRGRVFRLRAYELPEGSRTAKGSAIMNLLSIDQGENITASLSAHPDQAGKAYAFMTTRRGTVKKTLLLQYKTIRRNGMVAIKLDTSDTLRWVKLTSGTDDIMLVTEHGQSIRFNENDVRPTGRDTVGVRGILLGADDAVTSMDLIDEEVGFFVTIMERGMGKQTDIHQWALQKRGGRGIKAAQVTEKTGAVVDARLLRPKDKSLIMSSAHGQVIKLPLSTIPKLGRQTQGVILMRLPANDAVSAVIPLSKTTDAPLLEGIP